jgi:lysozyme
MFFMPQRKKKPFYQHKIFQSIAFIIALSIGGYYLYIWWMEKQAGFAHYPAFGISLPIDFQIHGIDVSTHQGMISWDDVHQMKVKDVDLKFAFIKATEGYTKVDWQFKRNWKRARSGNGTGCLPFLFPPRRVLKQAENLFLLLKLKMETASSCA